MQPVITTEKLTKHFGNFIAANELTFEVEKGEISETRKVVHEKK